MLKFQGNHTIWGRSHILLKLTPINMQWLYLFGGIRAVPQSSWSLSLLSLLYNRKHIQPSFAAHSYIHVWCMWLTTIKSSKPNLIKKKIEMPIPYIKSKDKKYRTIKVIEDSILVSATMLNVCNQQIRESTNLRTKIY
jgi:hypothetical protein